MQRFALALLLVLLLAPASALAETYVCPLRDEKGRLIRDKRGRAIYGNFSNVKRRGCRPYASSIAWGKAPARKPDKDDDANDTATGRKAERYRPPPRAGASGADEPEDRAGRERLYTPYIEEAAQLYDLPEAFLRAIIRVESNFKYRALSPVGAQGLMQLMPVTAREMGVADVWDPRQNILGGAKLVRVLANRYDGDIVQVLSAYSSGAGSVARAGGTIPSEAVDRYVQAVLDYYYQYKILGP